MAESADKRTHTDRLIQCYAAPQRRHQIRINHTLRLQDCKWPVNAKLYTKIVCIGHFVFNLLITNFFPYQGAHGRANTGFAPSTIVFFFYCARSIFLTPPPYKNGSTPLLAQVWRARGSSDIVIVMHKYYTGWPKKNGSAYFR